MDFSVSGSDSWETTAAQENFIQNYFQEQKLPISSKSLKRKRKRMRDRNLVVDQHQQKEKKSMEVPIEKSSQPTEMDSLAKLSTKPSKKKLKKQIKDIPDSTEGNTISKFHVGSAINHDFLCTENKASKKLKNKNKNSLALIKSKLKMDQSGKKIRSVSQLDEFIPIESNLGLKNSKKKKIKRASELNEDLDLEQDECLQLKPNSIPINSKKKKMKKTSELNKNLDLEQEEFIPLEPNLVTKNSKKKKMKKISELNENHDLKQEDFIPLVSNSLPKNSKKKKIKKTLELNEDLDSEHDDCLPFEPNSTLKCPKKKKTKKTLELKGVLGLKQSESLLLENSEPKISKKKNVKKTFDKDLDLEEFSGDSCEESDEELVSEIKNNEIFKEIEELMKQSPFQSNLKGSGKSVNKQSAEESDESIGELSDEDSEKSFGELSSEDSDNSSSEVALVPKVVQVAKNVKESSKLPEKQTTLSKVGTYSTNDQDSMPDKISNEHGSLKLRNDAKSLVRNVNSKKQTVASALKNKAQQKLQAAKFRFLNEKLYTETGGNAFQYFQENVDEFHDYHLGYSLQVCKWPMNPVSKIISDLQNLQKNIVIADMGCGDAKIAQTLTNSTVHSFDIVALNEFVKACDISKVPLQKESVDVVVFCLSLMGTNLKDYLMEAHRILKMGGMLKIAEVESRIDVNTFVKNLKPMGFSLQNQDLKHKVFVFLDFKKEKNKFKKANIPSITLRPCLYKKR